MSERLQAPAPENEVEVESFFENFYLDTTDGITISGGEPFEQLSELCKLVEYFSQRGFSDILIYTGYTLEELNGMRDERIGRIFSKISVLIDGPYVKALDTGKGNLKGSDNQRIIFFNPNFREKYAQFYSDERKMQEFYLGNVLLATGIPDGEYIKKFEDL